GSWFLFVSLADKTGEAIGDAVDDAFGAADPDTFEVKIASCESDREGAVLVEGTIENTASDTRNFQVEVEFVQQDEVVDSGIAQVLDVAPGDRQPWTTDGFVSPGQSVRCSVVGVNNLLN
ncbi:MAG: FxLYD domain-containing protein, partial [Acidimicrobiales bacterium]